MSDEQEEVLTPELPPGIIDPSDADVIFVAAHMTDSKNSITRARKKGECTDMAVGWINALRKDHKAQQRFYQTSYMKVLDRNAKEDDDEKVDERMMDLEQCIDRLLADIRETKP